MPVTHRHIHELWSSRKLDSVDAMACIVESRCMGSQRFYSVVEWHIQEELKRTTVRLLGELRERLEASLADFYHQDGIDRFLGQFDIDVSKPPAHRSKPLVLIGDSESGKSKKAASLFGATNTLQVNCQGMAPSLPSIREFDRTKHLAILWDEIEPAQVLNNKMVFQSGLEMVSLQQSACNGFAYQKWLYRIPMILCSNKFHIEGTAEKPMPPEDIQWLRQNLIVCEPPDGGKWFMQQMCQD